MRTYRKWEKGGTTNCDFQDYCDELDVSFNWLMSGEGKFLSERHYLDDLAQWVPEKGRLTDAGRPFISGTIDREALMVGAGKRNACRRFLLVAYAVVVILLTTYPWNVIT